MNRNRRILSGTLRYALTLLICISYAMTTAAAQQAPEPAAPGEGILALNSEEACEGGEIYDDGTAEQGYSTFQVGPVEFVHLMNPDGESRSYTEVCVGFGRPFTGGNPVLNIEIVAFVGSTGVPGTEIIAIPATLEGIPNLPNWKWFEIDISATPITVDAPVFIGARWMSHSGVTSRYIKADESLETPLNPGFFNEGFGFEPLGDWFFERYRALMVRARTEPYIEITLDPEPDDEGRYVIDATPMMPLIKAIPEIVGITPDPTPETTFTWEASLAIDRPCPGVPCELLFDDDIRQDVETEGEDPYQLELLDQSQLRGGRLKIAASATVDGAELTGERGADEDDELKVVGTNPQRAHIQNEIETGVGGAMGGLDGDEVADALKRIACHESGQRQFDVAADGGIGDVCLTFDNGIGIFQITNTNNCPRPAYESCRHVLFDWRANVAEGLASFGSKVVSARNYPENLRTSTAYRQYIERAINPQRVNEGLEEPITGTPAPDFTMTGRLGDEPPNQVLEDAVRGYHGYGCNATPWEGLLHEFTPDDHFLIHVPDEELPELDVDPRVWRRVNPVERTPACEVPDYVDLVIGRTAACAVDWPDNRPRCRTW